MSAEQNQKIINWRALLYKENIKSVLLVILILTVLFLVISQKISSKLEKNREDYFALANMNYNGQFESLQSKIDQAQEVIYQKMNDFDTDSTILITLKKDIENLEGYKKEIESLKKTKSLLQNSINVGDAPYITFTDSTKKNDLVISKNEMIVLLRFLFGLTENIRDDRFELKEISDLRNEYSEIFLLDKSLGSIWILDKKKNKFDNIKIENLSKERRNKEIDNFIEIIIERTSGQKINLTPSK